MKALRTKTPAALDNPTRWNQYLKPWFDVESYQERINSRVGLNKDGRPIIRLVWGQDVTTRAYYVETPRYWTRRQKAHPGFTWWTVPRWIFEKRLEPEQYVTAWNEKRYALTDPSTGSNHRCTDCGWGGEPKIIDGKLYCSNCVGTNITGGAVVDKGPPPDEYHTFMLECAVHETVDQLTGWAHCCTRAFYSDRMRCWGLYRPPSDLDLQVLTQAVRQMEADKFVDPYRALSAAELAETDLAANMQVERSNQMFEEWEREQFKQFNALHGWRVTGDEPPGFHDIGALRPAVTKETL